MLANYFKARVLEDNWCMVFTKASGAPVGVSVSWDRQHYHRVTAVMNYIGAYARR